MRHTNVFRGISAAVLLSLSTSLLAQTTQYATTQFAYDAQGNLTQVTDPRGLVTTFTYDALGRRTQVQVPPATSGGPVPTTVFTYDGQDRVSQVTDPRSLVTTYTIDGLGNTTAQQSPDTGVSNATYDAAGNLITRTDARGKTTTYTYDALNRLTKATYASGTPTVIEYDGGTSPLPNDIGRLTKITDESGSTRLQYDGFGNLVQKTQISNANGAAVTQTVAYAYGTSGSATGHLVSKTYPSGNVIGYSYDAAGRIAGLTLTTLAGNTALLSNIQYQPFGKPTGWTWGNGTAYTRSFDLNGRLTQFPLGATTGSGATPNGLSRTVNYDVASRITAYTHTDTTGSPSSSIATAANQTFGYDDNDRLISYLPAASSQSYSYDANGNRVGQTVNGSSYTQSVDSASNRQTASTGPTPTTNSYDAAGNQTGDGVTTYSYSDRGRLVSVTNGSNTTSYLYNGLGQRTVKQGTTVPTGANLYVYDDAGHLIGEYDQAGNAIQETVYLGDTPVATIKNGTAYYIYADQIDTPRVITDTNNLMVWRWDQADPFGAAQPDGNPSGQGTFTYNPRFPGQLYDQETGKHYNVNRDYDPAGGRYVQSDPIGLHGGQASTYSYVGGNPLSWFDPLGLAGIEERDLAVETREPTIENVRAAADIARLQELIRQVRPNYTYETVSARGANSYTYRDVEILTNLTRDVLSRENSQQCKSSWQSYVRYARGAGVRRAWQDEVAGITAGRGGSRRWTDEELQQLISNGRVAGYEGHHINGVAGNPGLASNPNNVEFMPRSEHLENGHGGNWANPSSGSMIER
ncbi:RHS repeat-associated core domain-containing protein [Ralstonia sp. A12]|uniref:RHS repeat-associated core domain-containing protein n=1 Tax=Ralstonia sp. A12 TaxID=1217052 RepID=UPI000B1EF335|nr:RHS repeat-associated core domain-containing protein [Ralstonia sp. A12]